MKFDTLDKFLNYGIFNIPEYQRGYSWNNAQLTDFVNDLSDVQYIREHYVGTVTLIKTGMEQFGISDKTVYDIVDGQQRLTTFIILLNEIICFARGLKENEGKSIKKNKREKQQK